MVMHGPDGYASRPPKGTTQPSKNKAKPKSSSGFYDPGNTSYFAGASAPSRGTASAASNQANEIAAIMARSGSNDPSDPYNWKGIAASLSGGWGDIGNAAASGAVTGAYSGADYGGGGGGSNYGSSAPAAPQPVASTAGIEALPITTPAQLATVTPPSIEAAGVESIVNPSMEKSGVGGTYGEFERRRRARGPRTGLSFTPEMLRNAASRRLG